jgi:RimJ/RimL family protein N-acetyltransferase
MAITLRPFTHDDIPRLLGWINAGGEESFAQWAGTAFQYPLTEAQLDEHLAEAEGPRPPRRVFAAVDDSTGEVVGHAELSRIDYENRSAMVSRLLVGDRALRGQGIGGEIVARLLEYAFGELRLHRLTIYVLEFVVAAIRMYERLGFRTEGHLVEARRLGDRYWNVYYMALLREEWEARREA